MERLLLVALLVSLALGTSVPEFEEKSWHSHCFLKKITHFSCSTVGDTTLLAIELINAKLPSHVQIGKFGVSDNNEYFLTATVGKGWWTHDVQLVFTDHEEGCLVHAKSQSSWFSFFYNQEADYCAIIPLLEILNYHTQDLYDCENTVSSWTECLKY